ncbi:hypothetical protein JCM24511_09715 [Saitozyma sp. JCM 24511]|nr:hypothetical protein JCM24511_09715 [Saitozyma sp. JCM 24511]
MPKTAKITKDTKVSGQPSCFGYFSAAAKAPKPVLPSRPDRDPFLASAPVPSAFALPPPPQLTAKASTTTLSPQPSRSTSQHSSHPITPKRSITRSPQGSARNDTHSSKDSFDSPFLVTPSIDDPRVSTGATPALTQVQLSEDGSHSKDVAAGPPQDVTMEDVSSVFGAEKAQKDGDQHLKELLFAIDNCLELAEQALPSTDPQAVQASGRADQIFVRTLLGRSTTLFPESSDSLMANLESKPNSKQKRSYKDWEQYM